MLLFLSFVPSISFLHTPEDILILQFDLEKKNQEKHVHKIDSLLFQFFFMKTNENLGFFHSKIKRRKYENRSVCLQNSLFLVLKSFCLSFPFQSLFFGTNKHNNTYKFQSTFKTNKTTTRAKKNQENVECKPRTKCKCKRNIETK